MNKKAENKTILFFNTNKAWGGGEKWHLEIASALFRQGCKPLMFCHENGQLFKEAQHSGFLCLPIKVNNLSFLNIFKILKLAAWIRNSNIDIIIMNLPADLKFAGLAARIAKVPRIIYRRGSAIPIKNTLLNRFLFRSVVTDILVNSEETRKTILSNNENLIDKNRIHLIFNGINIDEYDAQSNKSFYNKKEGELVIGNAGRMDNQKGQGDLLLLGEKLKNDGFIFKMIIAGEGKLKAELTERAKSLDLSELVMFPGFIKNIKSFMESIDVFVLPSRWEGFGYVLAEAMASAKPIVAYNVSSNPELVIDMKNGFLVEKGNINELYNRIQKLLNDTELRKQFGENGRRIVHEKFDFNKNLEELKEWLEVSRQSSVGS
ncbi:MAG: glycosyltransferase [Bacteroidota bacterium]|nr:glycosyltransferase [Bacteroidota bacterium]